MQGVQRDIQTSISMPTPSMSQHSRNKEFKTLKKWRAKRNFSPQVFYPFLQHLHAALNNKTLPYKKIRQTQIGKLIDEAIQEQKFIGWLQALHGRLSLK